MKKLAGGIYAVIYDQGSVKIGMSKYPVIFRIKDHRRTGKKFGIHVFHEIELKLEEKLLRDSERILLTYCVEHAIRTGIEWFHFDDVGLAVIALEDLFEKISQGIKLPIRAHQYISESITKEYQCDVDCLRKKGMFSSATTKGKQHVE